MYTRIRFSFFIALLVLLAGGAPASAQVDCGDPFDLTGTWEWTMTTYCDGETRVPNVGLSQPMQAEITGDDSSVLWAVYKNEVFQSSMTMYLTCIQDDAWWMAYDPGNWGEGCYVVSVSGLPGERQLVRYFHSVDCSTSYYTERLPLGSVPVQPLGWDSIKAIYR